MGVSPAEEKRGGHVLGADGDLAAEWESQIGSPHHSYYDMIIDQLHKLAYALLASLAYRSSLPILQYS